MQHDYRLQTNSSSKSRPKLFNPFFDLPVIIPSSSIKLEDKLHVGQQVGRVLSMGTCKRVTVVGTKEVPLML